MPHAQCRRALRHPCQARHGRRRGANPGGGLVTRAPLTAVGAFADRALSRSAPPSPLGGKLAALSHPGVHCVLPSHARRPVAAAGGDHRRRQRSAAASVRPLHRDYNLTVVNNPCPHMQNVHPPSSHPLLRSFTLYLTAALCIIAREWITRRVTSPSTKSALDQVPPKCHQHHR